jgi:hypothetical protein
VTVQQMRRPGADVQAIQLTARALPAIRSELAARDIHHEVHPDDGHLLLHSDRGPRPLWWGDWLIVEEDGHWDVYGNSVIEGWLAA